MATFNIIADEIAGALNRPFDDMFKERIKSIFRHELARMLRQTIDRSGIDRSLVQRYTDNLIEIDSADAMYETGCTIMRSESKIFRPVRFKAIEPFTFIGNDDIPFVYRTSVEGKRFTLFLSLGGKATYYDYRNEYIYVYNGRRFKYFTLEAIYEDPTDILPLETAISSATTASNCKDDMVIPVAGDLIQLVKDKLLSGELSIIDDKDKIKSEHIDNN